jgi:hypothetical protein
VFGYLGDEREGTVDRFAVELGYCVADLQPWGVGGSPADIGEYAAAGLPGPSATTPLAGGPEARVGGLPLEVSSSAIDQASLTGVGQRDDPT